MTVSESGPVRYARNGEVTIAFEDLGGAGGDPLLLVMGLGVSRFWWPQGLIDELIGRDSLVGVHEQGGEDIPGAGAAERQRPPVHGRLQRTEDAELHGKSTVSHSLAAGKR